MASHTWLDDYDGMAILEVKDGEASDRAYALVVVGNAAPVVGDIVSPLNPIPAGSVVKMSVELNDPGVLDTHTAVWHWGDGETSPGVVLETDGAGSVSGSHTYALPGEYTVTVTVNDDDGGIGWSDTHVVLVAASEPMFARGDANADETLDIGDVIFALSYLFADGPAAPPGVRHRSDSG